MSHADDLTTPSVETPPETASTERIAQLEKQIQDYKLLLADFENSRKRLAQETLRQSKYAVEPLARDILGVIDNLERAMEAAEKAGDNGPLAQGVNATITLFLDTLKRQGVKRVSAAPGTEFDPNLHMAVSQVSSPDNPPGAIVQVLQHGYLLHDRILRPASVIVAADA